tara:strand:- start:506 stop:1060 length:555 start_codon:yes stop_codon:yes gene_type:complete
MDNFNLTKFFRNQYLAEGEWKDLSSKDLEDYKDDIIGLITQAYSYIGGHSNYSSTGDVAKEASRGADYEVIDLDDDGDLDAVNVSKTKSAGTKFVATGHDGSSQAKRAVITHKIDRLKKPGFYVEVSGKIQDILLKAGVPQVTDEATIEKALAGKDIKMSSDGSYQRKIGGAWHTKVLLGQPLI